MRAMGGTVRSLPLRSLQWRLIKDFRRTFSFLSVNITLSRPSCRLMWVLSVSFLAPPSDPFLAVLERELLILLFVSITWAYVFFMQSLRHKLMRFCSWVCLGIRFADMARTVHDPSAPLSEVITGKFLEPGVSTGVLWAFSKIDAVTAHRYLRGFPVSGKRGYAVHQNSTRTWSFQVCVRF